MQQPHIVPYSEVWKADVERLCARIWGPERQQYRYGGSVELDAGGTKEPSSYVALLGDQVLGFCTMWRNLFHPMALYFTVAVRPGWERRGIGGRLPDHLEQDREEKSYETDNHLSRAPRPDGMEPGASNAGASGFSLDRAGCPPSGLAG
ncbi:GNAT family N-acetyltransferase [Paenibacillus thiaminolyticus]